MSKPSHSSAPTSSASSEITALCHANVLTPNGLLKGTTLQMHNGVIQSIGTEVAANHLLRSEDVHMVHLGEDYLITPAFIDLQINGAFGVDFSAGNLLNMKKVLDTLPQQGVSAILPTVVTASLMDMINATNAIEELIHFNTRVNSTKVLGIHLEGPFLNPEKRGTHPKEHLLPIDMEALELLLSPHVKMMTYAPELDENFELLDALCEKGILTFAGHSNVERGHLSAAKNRGLQGVTHLYNAFGAYTHRHVGSSLHALLEKDLWASLITDGYHVHPEVVELTLKVKGVDKLVLVSDAMNLAGLNEGEKVAFAGTLVQNKEGRAINAEGHLAGSTQLLPEMIRNLLNWNICSLEQAFQMATHNPAQLLGLDDHRGSLKEGYVADVLLWHQPTMKLLATWVAGELRWCDQAVFQPDSRGIVLNQEDPEIKGSTFKASSQYKAHLTL
jgi:N-acetylglucosamine-6-phosphate deacetylase